MAWAADLHQSTLNTKTQAIFGLATKHICRSCLYVQGYVLGRTHINSCDFSLDSYTFDDHDGDASQWQEVQP